MQICGVRTCCLDRIRRRTDSTDRTGLPACRYCPVVSVPVRMYACRAVLAGHGKIDCARVCDQGRESALSFGANKIIKRLQHALSYAVRRAHEESVSFGSGRRDRPEGSPRRSFMLCSEHDGMAGRVPDRTDRPTIDRLVRTPTHHTTFFCSVCILVYGFPLFFK